MKDYVPQTGDIVLIDSNRTGAKIIKYLMRSPTIWQDLWRMYRKTLEYVEYYHCAAMYEIAEGIDTKGIYTMPTLIEQQWKVQFGAWNENRRQVIFRRKNLTEVDFNDFRAISSGDLGETYDILNIFGKLITWLTGLKFFARYMQIQQQEICVNRVSSWYLKMFNEKFGCVSNEEVTTHIIYKYLLNNPNYEVVYVHA